MELIARCEDGVVTWHTDGLDGPSALWLLCDVLVDLYRYHFQSDLRPVFPVESGRVCIEFQAEKLAIAFRPEDNLGAAKALTAAALVALCETGLGGTINPFEIMFGALVRDVVSPVEGRILAPLGP